ncbi:acetyl-CoA synthetase-like protein [Xylaria intraflava]|nr:acetyl-CoA synthetase-like protein [Xylaria intraflava]
MDSPYLLGPNEEPPALLYDDSSLSPSPGVTPALTPPTSDKYFTEIPDSLCPITTRQLSEIDKRLDSDTAILPLHSLSGVVSRSTKLPGGFTATALLAAVCLVHQFGEGDSGVQVELYHDNQNTIPIKVPETAGDTIGELLLGLCHVLPREIQQEPSRKQRKLTVGIFPPAKKNSASRTPQLLYTAIITSTDLILEASYDTLLLTRTRSLSLLRSISSILRQLLESPPDSSTRTISHLSPEDLETINTWNFRSPPPDPVCVHDSIARWGAQTPDAEAIDAWDGQLSFKDLDELSSRLAVYFRNSCSIKPGDIVPLCIGRSALALVSMLGVMKSGAAFVPLNPSAPRDRNLDIMDICGADKLFLDSFDKRYQDAGLVISWKLIHALPPSDGAELPRVVPSDRAYVIFTSGTTGRPKGVVIEHQNLFYSLKAHGGDIYRQGPTSRVLQFAALTFDASMTEHLAPLTLGGCVCVPDNETRLSGIAEYINTRRVNWAFFTPSFFKLLTPDDVPCLKTVVLGGEAITNDCIDRWSHRIRLINGYGPSEATIVATACVVEPMIRERASIGKSLVCRTWVVDADDHTNLLPIGAVGELVIQGPTVARGYLNDPVKTEAAFIHPPGWANAGDDHRYQRMYKTGDLVRYDDDGSLIYMGRKDTQVKVRGQRLELSEVEHHLPDNIQHGVAMVPRSGVYKGRLVVVMVGWPLDGSSVPVHSVFRRPNEAETRKAYEIAEAGKKSMSEKLPDFAIPDVWIPVQTIPTSNSGKLDRIAVRDWVESLQADDETLEVSEIGPGVKDERDATEAEKIIQEAFANALGLPLNKVSLDRSFQSHGGDSLQAIQVRDFYPSCHFRDVVGKCRSRSLQLNIMPILKGDTIRQLGLKSSYRLYESGAAEQIDSPFALSPIQHLYVNSNPPPTHYFNQTRVIRLKQAFESDRVLEALSQVIRAHSMLRTRLVRDEAGKPHQQTGQDASIHFQHVSASSLDEAATIIKASQRTVDISSGPVVAANLISLKDQSALLSLTVAHFSIDIVSWGIIFEDLESCLRYGQLSSPASLSFQAWCRQLEEAAEDEWSKNRLLPFDLPANDPDTFFSFPNPNTYGHVLTQKFHIDSSATNRLLSSCTASSISVLDILLAVLFKGFADSFPSLQSPVIHSEGHGRQAWRQDQDISRTVGWFTSLAPIPAPKSNGNIWHTAHSIRHFRGQLFHGGMPYFNSLFRGNDGRPGAQRPMAVVFNYMGQEQQQTDQADALFEVLPEFQGESGDDASADMPRFSIFEIAAEVRHGEMHFSFMWPEGLECDGDVSGLVSRCQAALECASAEGDEIAPAPSCDLMQLQADYDTSLSILRNAEEKLSPQVAAIAKISPASATQQAMLLSQDVNQRFFQTRLAFSIQHPNVKLDNARLLSAWKQLVNRHAILRTVFVRRPGEPDQFDQVILEHTDPRVEILKAKFNSAQSLIQLPPAKWEEHEPQLKLTVANGTSDQMLLLLECSHAMTDHVSLQLMFQGLSTAWSDSHENRGEQIQFVDLVDERNRENTREGDLFWRKLFAANPRGHLCHGAARPAAWNTHRSLTLNLGAETRTALQSLCERTSLTMALVVRFAWAVVLAQYLGSDRVAFGYVVAGRDVDFSGIESIVGPCLSILGCVATLGDDKMTVAGCLEMLRGQFLDSLPHQRGFLESAAASVREGPGSSSFATPTNVHFDTLVNFRSHTETKGDSNGPQFRVEGESDPFDYAVVLEVDSYPTGDMAVTFSYWEEALGDEKVNDISDRFVHVLGQIPTVYDKGISEVFGV